MEVFCSPDSELTRQMQNLGKAAQRISLDQADLSTVEGRQFLFQRVLMYKPKNIWYSPTVVLGVHGAILMPADRWKVLI